MPRLITLLFVLTASLFAADTAGGVREAAAGWRQAVIKQDEAALQRWLADDMLYSHANGRTQNKAEYIAPVTKRSGNPSPGRLAGSPATDCSSAPARGSA